MKIKFSSEIKDLVLNLASALVISISSVIAYDKFFVPKFPAIFAVDVPKLREEIRQDILAQSFNNNGIPVEEKEIIKRVEDIVKFIEKIGKDNEALIFHKENIVVDGVNVKDITEQVLELDRKQRSAK